MIEGEHVIAEMTLRWTLPPSARLPSRVRQCLAGIYGQLLEPDDAHSLEMASHELLENVLKYSAEGGGEFDVVICENAGRRRVRVRTSNTAAIEQVGELQRLVARIASPSDPLSIYDDLIATSHTRKGSGLGLARIRAEAEMKVTCAADGHRITITAERPVQIPKDPGDADDCQRRGRWE